jgi:hypothetical protein
MIRTYEQIKQAVINKGYNFFEDKNYNLNFIWERTSDEITNHFTDLTHILYLIDNKPQILTVNSTTKPGLKGSIDSPITTPDKVTGTAVIIPNQYRSSWEFIDGDYENAVNPIYPFKIPYFKQIKGINYWRDGNKDLIVDHVQEQDNKLFGTHWHVMSNKNESGFAVNRWSKGCMGLEWPNYVQVINLTRIAVKIWGNVFTGTIIESKDII